MTRRARGVRPTRTRRGRDRRAATAVSRLATVLVALFVTLPFALAVGLAAAAGEEAGIAPGAPPAPSSPDVVSVLYGPSLERIIKTRIAPEFARSTGIRFAGERQPSLAELRLTTQDGRPADVAIVTDPELLSARATAAQAPYYVVFAANAMVVAYRRDSPYGKAIAAGKVWFEALGLPGVHLGRPDPALDPLGQRAIFVLQLARRYYETADLAAQILRPGQIVPAADLMGKLQRGEIDVALAYRSQAVEAGLPLLDLPVEINLSDPGRRGVYAEASLEVGGDVQRGAPIVLAAAPLAGAPDAAAALRFVDFLSSPAARRLLDEDGYVVPSGLPLRRAWAERP